jgi:hypothetical protein
MRNYKQQKRNETNESIKKAAKEILKTEKSPHNNSFNKSPLLYKDKLNGSPGVNNSNNIFIFTLLKKI